MYREGANKAPSKFVENARNYITLLTQHIEKEDNILFPMADMRLSKERREELLDKFEKVEIEKIGTGKYKELNKLLAYLKGVYLE